MVAVRIHRAPESAHNVVRRTERKPLVEGRKEARARVACRAWLCAADASARGYALDVSAHGARFGGMGLLFAVGDRVLAKIVLEEHGEPLVMKAEIVRYAPASSCPELCVKFIDDNGDSHFRLARYVDNLRPCAYVPSSTSRRGP